MPRTRALLFTVPFLLLATGVAHADEGERRRPSLRDLIRKGIKQLRVESTIERVMALGHLRGLFSPRPPRADWTPRTHKKGRLERGPGGVPILYLEGTPAEMGEQHGALLKNEIEALRRYVLQFVGPRRVRKARRRARKLFEQHVPQDYLTEARALSKASGIPYEQIKFAQWFSDIYRGFACSTLSAPSKEGAFLARNLDFPTMGYLQKYSIVLVARPKGKRPYVSITWPGLIGVLSGQNRSLAVSVMVVHDVGGAHSGLPFQLAFRRVLEKCDDTKQAEALLRKTPLTCANNLMIVDKPGRSRVLELHPDGITARAPKNGRLVATNHFVASPLKQPRASITVFSSRRRFRAVEKTCPRGEGPVTIAQARKALAAASVNFTAQSMIFLPARGEVEVAFVKRGSAAKGRFVRIKAKQLLGE